MSDDTSDPPYKRLQTLHPTDAPFLQATVIPTSSSSPFLRAVVDRRTRQSICNVSPIPHSRIVDIVSTAVKYVPSAFNCQSSRTITLLNLHHDRFWDEVLLALQQLVPPEKFATTQERILGFKNGVGTVLFFEDYGIVKSLIEQFPLYTDKYVPLPPHHHSYHHHVILIVVIISIVIIITTNSYHPHHAIPPPHHIIFLLLVSHSSGSWIGRITHQACFSS